MEKDREIKRQGYELKSTIHSNQFMIIAMNKDGGEMAVRPEIFVTYAEALHKSQTMASEYRFARYIVVAVAAVSQTVENPVVSTSYKICTDNRTV